MAAGIRLRRMGTKNRKTWRLVVCDQRKARDGEILEDIGFYNPLPEPPKIQVRLDRYEEWIRRGAEPSGTVRRLIQKLRNPNHAN